MAKQDWTVGQKVKVGFLTLEVVEKIATPGNWLPDHYALKNDKGAWYAFIPHNGLFRVPSLQDAREAA